MEQLLLCDGLLAIGAGFVALPVLAKVFNDKLGRKGSNLENGLVLFMMVVMAVASFGLSRVMPGAGIVEAGLVGLAVINKARKTGH